MDRRSVWKSHCEVEIEPRTSADRRPARTICQVTEVEPAPATSADAGTTASAGGPDTVGPGCPHPATDGSIMPTNAGGTGAIGGDGLGNHVTELASGRNSHGGGRCFAGSVSRFRRGVFFVRGFCLQDGRRNKSETSSSWDRVLQRGPRASRWETLTDPGRGVGRPDQ